eukprot:scaffold5784_cov150-Skeletonema_menzelii.AAC.1
MASSTRESASEDQSSSVQPSATLIEALHHKLCDPSIVADFEQCRSPNITQRLISPRWILKRDTNPNGQPSNNNNSEPKYNTVPQRTHLDIRVEQNTRFANDQCLRCQKKLAALSSTSPKSVEAINVNRTTIKKILDSITNHLKEGLAACPNHEGLAQVESEVRGWLDRLNGVNDGFQECPSKVLDTAAAAAATRAEERRGNKNETVMIDLTEPKNTQQHHTVAVKRKGGEGRAQAAIDDAMVEKMFMQGHGDRGGGESTNHGDGADNTNNNLKWVPPASRVDESADQHMRGNEDTSDSDSYHNRKRSRHHRQKSSRYRRSRSRSVERREDRRKGERRHSRHHRRRRDDDRKRKKRRHRSRSRSMSRGSSSPEASLSSRSKSRDRSNRRHRQSRHKRRHKSKSHKKERKKLSKRHRSRRGRSQSVSSSSSAAAGADDIKERFVPPQLSQSAQHGRKEEERPVRNEDVKGGSVSRSNDIGASNDVVQSGN